MEEAIEAFGGTCFIVSHDRYFLDKVVTRILEMDGGKLTEYLGNYTYYREKKKISKNLSGTGRERRRKGRPRQPCRKRKRTARRRRRKKNSRPRRRRRSAVSKWRSPGRKRRSKCTRWK